MSTTYRAWIDFLETLAPAGVVRQFTTGAPESLSTADIPAQWLELPHGENRPARAGAEGGDRTLYADHVMILEAVAQNKQAVNFDACVTMLDSIDTAIVGLGSTSPLIGPMTWRSRLAIVTVANVAYWAIVTTIEGLG